jgi:hypothetical protein
MRIRILDLYDLGWKNTDPGPGINFPDPRYFKKKHYGRLSIQEKQTGVLWDSGGSLPDGKLSYAGCHADYEEGSSYSDADYTRDQRVLNDL